MARGNGSIDQIENGGNDKIWVNDLTELLASMDGEVVYAHNALFDVAFQIAQLQPNRMGRIPEVIRRIRWRDTGLLFI